MFLIQNGGITIKNRWYEYDRKKQWYGIWIIVMTMLVQFKPSLVSVGAWKHRGATWGWSSQSGIFRDGRQIFMKPPSRDLLNLKVSVNLPYRSFKETKLILGCEQADSWTLIHVYNLKCCRDSTKKWTLKLFMWSGKSEWKPQNPGGYHHLHSFSL